MGTCNGCCNCCWALNVFEMAVNDGIAADVVADTLRMVFGACSNVGGAVRVVVAGLMVVDDINRGPVCDKSDLIMLLAAALPSLLIEKTM